VGTAPVETNFVEAHVRSLQQVAMWRWQSLVLTGVENTDSIFALEVSDNLFDALGTPAAVGRTLVASDFGSSAPTVAVISDRLWRQHFRGDPGIVGRQILLDGQGYSVVGVMGPDFVFTNPAHQAWIPYKPGGRQEELSHAFSTLARLSPSVSV